MGLPIGVNGKVDHGPRAGKLKGVLFFATPSSLFANLPAIRKSLETLAATKPQDARNPEGALTEVSALSGFSCHSAGKAGPQPGDDPRKPRFPLPRPGLPPIGHMKVRPRLVSGQPQTLVCFREVDIVFALVLGTTQFCRRPFLRSAVMTVELAEPKLETLSPSRAGDFKTCPQLFKFRAIDKIAEPPSVYQARGTTAHLALQRIFDESPANRTPERLYDLFREAWTELRDADEFSDLFSDIEEERQWGIESMALLANYFNVEDPAAFDPLDRELDMLEDLGEITIRGILDRMDRDPGDGRLVILDYKTGKAPPERYALPAFFALKIYALLIRKRTGETPKEVRLMYLNGPTLYRHEIDDRQLDAMESQLHALWNAIERAIARDQYPPRPGRLCDWCSYQEICPAWSAGADEGL